MIAQDNHRDCTRGPQFMPVHPRLNKARGDGADKADDSKGSAGLRITSVGDQIVTAFGEIEDFLPDQEDLLIRLLLCDGDFVSIVSGVFTCWVTCSWERMATRRCQMANKFVQRIMPSEFITRQTDCCNISCGICWL